MSERLFAYPWADIYRLYVQKVERKGRTVAELDDVLGWLTGYTPEQLRTVDGDLRDFFAQAPAMTPDVDKITGVVCGVRVEEVDDPLMQQIRWADKLVDELAKGKAVEKIKRV
ncbi:DUF2200 domain-containing protein [Corynebacterium sp.]|uniref:DUF2200 domain-containing protein n=1 Tax=Corynebacterium sp. TaxID=1720 RepID=UPI0026DF7A68|nr:DUF2200 domain-containing protein [Corynebacterium sp.]MDO5512353.1 DUF2200 domain-containing protein [Corynebacterium sp.]